MRDADVTHVTPHHGCHVPPCPLMSTTSPYDDQEPDMTVYDIRVKADTTGYYARHAGVTFGTRDTREEAQSVIDAAFYGDEWAEIVEREVAA